MTSDQSEDMIYSWPPLNTSASWTDTKRTVQRERRRRVLVVAVSFTKCLARAASSENENQALENCSLRPGTVTWWWWEPPVVSRVSVDQHPTWHTHIPHGGQPHHGDQGQPGQSGERTQVWWQSGDHTRQPRLAISQLNWIIFNFLKKLLHSFLILRPSGPY